MATNRPDTLDPALLRPGRLDRKVEFGLPDLDSRTQIFQIHTRTMNCERDIRFELLARLCPNSTGADVRSVCTEAGMFAIRARRKTVTEKDFLDAVNKVRIATLLSILPVIHELQTSSCLAVDHNLILCIPKLLGYNLSSAGLASWLVGCMQYRASLCFVRPLK